MINQFYSYFQRLAEPDTFQDKRSSGKQVRTNNTVIYYNLFLPRTDLVQFQEFQDHLFLGQGNIVGNFAQIEPLPVVDILGFAVDYFFGFDVFDQITEMQIMFVGQRYRLLDRV